MLHPPLRKTLGRLSLIALLLLPGLLPAQTAPAPEPDAPTARATCETELAASRWPQALPACQAVLQDAERLLGPEDESVGYWLLVVGRVLHESGSYAEAVPLVQRALRILQKVHGDQHPDVAMSLNNLAALYRAQGQYAQAEPLYKRSLAIYEKALGADHPDVALSLNNLAELYRAQGQYAQAEPLHKRSLAIYEKALGANHPDVALSLNNLAELYRAQGQYAQAEPLYKRSLAIYEKALGADHPDVARSLNNLAALYQAQGQYAQAEPLYKRSLAIYEKALGTDHPDVAMSLNNLAALYRAQGQYAQAEPLYKRSLAIYEKALGADHPDVARSLNNLAELYRAQGQYAQAEPLHKRSLAIYEKALGTDHPDVAMSLNNLAELYRAQGQYAQAEPLHKRSLAIYEKALGTDHPDVAMSLNNLAALYQAQGQYAQAEPLYKRSLAIYEKALGADHPDVALSLNNLAELYRAQGQYAQAEPLYKRSLGIREKTLPPLHPHLLASLGHLARLYLAGDTPSQALPYLTKLLDRSLERGGLYAGDSLYALHELGRLHVHLGQPVEAGAVFERFLSRLVAERGPAAGLARDGAERLAALLERAFFHFWLRRDYAGAEKFVAQVRGLAVAKAGAVAAALGRLQGVLEGTTATQRKGLALQARLARGKLDDHARRLFAAAIQEVAEVRPEEAARLLTEGLYVGEGYLRGKLGEAEVRAWLEVQRASLELSFELARQHPQSEALRRVAVLASLLSKGRSLDAETSKLRVLRSEATAQTHGALALRLSRLSGQAQTLALGGQGGLPLRDVRQQQKQTEDLLLASMGDLRVEALPEAWELVRRVAEALRRESEALHKDVVLVDYVDYVAPPLADGGGEGTRRYLALLLWPGEAQRTQVVDLGEAAGHQPALARLLRELRSPSSKPDAAAKEVYKRLLAPVLRATGAGPTLYVVPDGALSLIPFDALVDAGGKYVIDGQQAIRYLASGRDLLREYGAASGRPPLVLGDPDLQAVTVAAAPVATQGKGARGDVARAASLYASAASLPQLVEARAEAVELGRKLAVTPLVGADASEPRLRAEAKAGIGPKILHLAMHGLFPDDSLGPYGRGGRSRIPPVDPKLVLPDPPLPDAGEALDPMLHSALVLAGAKHAKAAGSPEADGLLSADEARKLSLEGTELTVLSACQTALGSLLAGNGVDGLRRAFLIAGSEAVVASLWRVDDPATRSLMARYYALLLDHQRPRITALREAMRAMKKDRPHPHYWAPFVAIGRDAPLRPLGHVPPQAQGK